MQSDLTRIARAPIAVAAAGLTVLGGAACGRTTGLGTAITVGVVAGTFVREGGPIGPNGQQPREVRLTGVIEFKSPGKHPVRVRIDKTGAFSVRLLPGKYSVSGSSPDVGGNCSQPVSVTVTRGHTSRVTVTCVVP